MKSKIFALAIIFFITTTMGVYALGFGGQLNFNVGEDFSSGASLVVSINKMTHIAFNWYLGADNVNTVGLTFDICPVTLQIKSFNAGSFNFTLGAGIFAGMIFHDDDDLKFNRGVRFPIGFNFMLLNNFIEIYSHVAPSFDVRFLPNFSLSNPFFPIAIGVRFWFI